MLSRTSTTALLFALLPIVIALIWNVLDANLSLFLYDAFVPSSRRYSNLQDKTVWVTGASSGIGAELVCELVQAKAAHVILSARRTERLQQVANRCQSESSLLHETRLSILPYDASLLGSVNQTVDAALALASPFGIDLFILNAGIYQLQPALETTLEQTEHLMQINYLSPVALTKALLNHRNHDSSRRHPTTRHIVVVTSLVARGAQSLTSSYAASKAALRNYFWTLSSEEGWWLTIQMALPGATDTELWKAATTTATTTTTRGSASSGSSSSNSNGMNDGGHDGSRDAVFASSSDATMSPRRVARLILTGTAAGAAAAAARPSWLSLVVTNLLWYELWISKPIGLVWIYLCTYAPTIHHVLIHIVGYIRVEVWKRSNQTCDALDIPTLVSTGVDMLRERVLVQK